ncbi:MAG: hypothetical protein ACYC0V_19090 [Armatimonadota bacterium]
MWRSIGAVLGVIIGSFIIWILFISAALNIGNWGGDIHRPIPIEAQIVASCPSVIGFIFGIWCIIHWFKTRQDIFFRMGFASFLMAGFLFFLPVVGY